MGEKQDEKSDDVSVEVNIEGKYDDVIARLRVDEDESRNLSPLIDESNALLDTIQRINGGTRSALAQALPEEASLSGNPDAVVEMLQVLERYDLVTLEGNTWKPGSNLN